MAENDLWQRSVLGVTAVGNDHAFVNETLDKVADFVAAMHGGQIMVTGRDLAIEHWDDGLSEGTRTLAEAEGAIPWTLLSGLDPADTGEPAFRTEPFCALISETAVGSEDPLEYLAAAVAFANQRLWGTLSATLLAPRHDARGLGVQRDRLADDLLGAGKPHECQQVIVEVADAHLAVVADDEIRRAFRQAAELLLAGAECLFLYVSPSRFKT